MEAVRDCSRGGRWTAARGSPNRFAVHGYVAPLGWEHIAFNGDYVWPAQRVAA